MKIAVVADVAILLSFKNRFLKIKQKMIKIE